MKIARNWLLFFSVGTAFLAGSGCKSLSQSGTLSGHTLAAEQTDISQLCMSRKPSILVRDKTIIFPPNSVEAAASAIHDDSFFTSVTAVEETQITGGKLWRLNQAFPLLRGASCVNDGTLVTTQQLAYLASCTSVSPCTPAATEAFCPDGTCVASGEPPAALAGGGDSPRDQDQGSMALSNELSCVAIAGLPANRRDFSVRNGEKVIGFNRAGPLEANCRDLISKAREGLVCTWTGKGYAPYRISDGMRIGSDVAPQDYRLCLTLLSAAKGGFVTSWDGRQYINYSVETATAIGGKGHPTVIKYLTDNLSTTNTGYLCAWTGSAYRIYDKNNTEFQKYGTFDTILGCKVALTGIDVKPVEDDNKSALLSLDLTTANIRQLRQLFNPGSENSSVIGHTFAKCRNPNASNLLVASDVSGQLNEDCKFDTLYSWGPSVKLTYYRALADRATWNGQMQGNLGQGWQDVQLYMTQSPTASFPYGPVPIRIKLRNNIRYRLILNGGNSRPDCSKLFDRDNTVLVFKWEMGNATAVDYVLCSMGPMHSFSFGRREMYDEMVKELNWVLDPSHTSDDYDLYYKDDGAQTMFGTVLDGHPRTEDVLTRSLRMLAADAGWGGNANNKIFYNPIVTDKTPEAHFGTRFPTYYNQR